MGRQEPNETEGSFTAEEVTIDGSRCIKITTSAPRVPLYLGIIPMEDS